eukprot:jgi/Mesvir1/17646/Mv08864-RA.1
MNTAAITHGEGLQRGCIISLHNEKGLLASIKRNGRWELDTVVDISTPLDRPNVASAIDVSMIFTLCVSDDRRYIGFRSAAANGMTLQACPGRPPSFVNWNFKSHEMWEIPHGATWADLAAGTRVTFRNARFPTVSLTAGLTPMAVLPLPTLSAAQQVQECNRQLISVGLEAERLVHDLRESEHRLLQQGKRDKVEVRRLAAQVSELQQALQDKGRQLEAMQAEVAWRAQESGALQELLRQSQAHGSELEEALLLWRVRQKQLASRGIPPPNALPANLRASYMLGGNGAPAGGGNRALMLGAPTASFGKDGHHSGYDAFAGKERDAYYGAGLPYHTSSSGLSLGSSSGRQAAAFSSSSSHAHHAMHEGEDHDSRVSSKGYPDHTYGSSGSHGGSQQDHGSSQQRRGPPPVPPPPVRGQSWDVDGHQHKRESTRSARLEDGEGQQIRRQKAPPKPLSSEQLAMATLQQTIREEIASGAAKARLRKVHPSGASQGTDTQGQDLSPRSRTVLARQTSQQASRQTSTASGALPESPASVDAASVISQAEVTESVSKPPQRRPLAPLSNNLVTPMEGMAMAKERKAAIPRKMGDGGVEGDQENLGRLYSTDLAVLGLTPAVGQVSLAS